MNTKALTQQDEKIEDLTTIRKEHLISCKKNSDNSHAIIAGLYSDEGHFIYELLQNADDEKAEKVTFTLTERELKFTHNAKKLFSDEDVNSITAVDSTKKNDPHSTGKFGVGFKSVFAVTDTPCIHSGGYHFKIVKKNSSSKNRKITNRRNCHYSTIQTRNKKRRYSRKIR